MHIAHVAVQHFATSFERPIVVQARAAGDSHPLQNTRWNFVPPVFSCVNEKIRAHLVMEHLFENGGYLGGN